MSEETTPRHPSDEDLQRLADLEPVDAAVAAHAESCDTCCARLADLALGSLDTDVALRLHADVLLAREAVRVSATLPIIVAIVVAALASLPLLGDAVSRLEHLRLAFDGLERMTQPLLRILTSPTTQIVAAAAAFVLCLLVLASIRRLSPSPAGEPS